MEDFNVLKVIGRGSYAKVLMCELKKTKQVYAMKVIKKSLVMDEEVKDHHTYKLQSYLSLSCQQRYYKYSVKYRHLQ